MWQTKYRQISPPRTAILQSERSHLIPTLTVHVADQVQVETPQWQFYSMRAHIWFLCWQLICSRPSVGRSTPQNCHFIDSYSESWPTWQLICGRPSVGRSTPSRTANFTVWELIFDSFADSSYGEDQVWADLPCQSTILQYESSYLIPTLRAHMWQTKCRQITPPNGNFTVRELIFDPYTDSSYVADQV